MPNNILVTSYVISDETSKSKRNMYVHKKLYFGVKVKNIFKIIKKDVFNTFKERTHYLVK